MAVAEPSRWKIHHTALRIKEPQRTVAFYQALGMSQINKMFLPDLKLDLIFMAYAGTGKNGRTDVEAQLSDQVGVLELLYAHGSEKDPTFKVANGNETGNEGFQHICVSVDNLEAACHRLEDAGYQFHKRLTDGPNPDIAFVLDPDGYWVELIRQQSAEETKGIMATNLGSYRFNHTMLRIKNANISLDFYQDVLGMKRLGTLDLEQAGYSLYFLGYAERDLKVDVNVFSAPGVFEFAGREGVLALKWSYGTEKLDGQVFHSGNEEPKGYGHVALIVDDLEAACRLMEERKVRCVKRQTDPPADHFAFFLDPDGYWIEMIQDQPMSRLGSVKE